MDQSHMEAAGPGQAPRRLAGPGGGVGGGELHEGLGDGGNANRAGSLQIKSGCSVTP